VSASYSGNIIIKNSVSGNSGNNYLTPGAQFVGRSSPPPAPSPMSIRGRTFHFNPQAKIL